MRILAFSDLHLARARAADLVAASHDADLVIAAGDYCGARDGLDRAMAMLDGMAAPVLAVPGNGESEAELRAAAPAGWQVLHGQGATVGGVRFFGLGYAVPVTPFGDWSCDLTEDQAAAMLDGCKAADVLIVHAPPKGIGDRISGGISVGSVAIRAAIERLQPQLAVCGHVHDSWGQTGTIGRTHVVNLGPTVNWFDVAPQ
jgi:Icc-related predicted phosphoesterase